MDRAFADAWAYALKPRSWPKLLVPAGLGHAIGMAAAGAVSWHALAGGLMLTLCMLAFVVLMNDWGDQEVDALKRRLFPESCSPKTIPDGILGSRAVLYGGLGSGAAALGMGVFIQEFLGRPGLAWVTGLCLLVFVSYSLPPVRLNYRGGGEILEMLGVGLLLPWVCGYVQSGTWGMPGLAVLPPFVLIAGSSALASGLSDEESDRLGGKKTFATLLGNAEARHSAEALLFGGMLVWAALPLLAPKVVSPWFLGAALIVMSMELANMRALSERAITGAFAEQGAYKQHLHRAIWFGASLVALGVLVAARGSL